MEAEKIVILGHSGLSTKLVYHYLSRRYNIAKVIIEESESKKLFLKRRAKRLGYFTVFGQVLFQVFASIILSRIAKKRVEEIIQSNQLRTQDIPEEKILKVPSVNNVLCIEKIKEINPDVIIVNGTRIISKKVIQAAPCKLINMHAGITPKYRGVHGGYWALANQDAQNCGVTIHYVDEGIDTGNILAQDPIHPTEKDNFVSYPFLQLAKGLELMDGVIKKELTRQNQTITNELESYLWYHPTLFQYIRNYIKTKVK